MNTQDKNDLMEYLEITSNQRGYLSTEERTRQIYREFYTFLGDSQLSAWYPDFITYLKQNLLSEFHLCLRYLRTVDFLHYRQQLETHLQ